jgi:hypothetical protein
MSGSGRRPWLAALLLVSVSAACAPAVTDDPAIRALERVLRPGDRLVLARSLDSGKGNRVAAVVRPGAGKPELRIYDLGDGRAEPAVVHRSQQGDFFRNLVLEDVTGDGQEEILATWTGGQLEILEVLGLAADGSYATLFHNGGQTIERRSTADGVAEFWITSRTYEEKPGQPPTYAVAVYRWDGSRFPEIQHR